jgi:hypothetical protein
MVRRLYKIKDKSNCLNYDFEIKRVNKNFKI